MSNVTITALDNLKKSLSAESMKNQIKQALPPHINSDKFIRVVMTAISTTPSLVEAERNSFFGACLKSAADGLIPDGKEAALVVYSGKVTYQPMTAGILKKIRNSGELSSINTDIVFKNDEFKYYTDENGVHFSHVPNLFADRGDDIGVYALAKTKDGGIYFEFLSKAQVEDIRKVSRAKEGPAWTGAFKHEMWKKSSIKRLSKRLPMSTDIDMTLHADDEVFLPPEPTPPTPPAAQPETPPTEPKVKTSKLKNAMKETVSKDSTPAETVDAQAETVPPGTDENAEIPI